MSKHPRHQVYKRAEIDGNVILHDEKKIFVAPILNVSVGGVFALGVKELPKGSEVRVVLRSAKLKEAVQARGMVVRVQRADGSEGLAIEFTSLSSRARELLANCVHESRTEGLLNERN